MKQMVDENIECALHIDDDAVFYRDWDKILESIPDEVENNGYINMGTSQFFNLQPKIRQVYQLPNNGGSEVFWTSLGFATSFLSNLNMNEAIDIVFHGVLMSTNKHILNIPIAHQTSDIERQSTLDHETRKPSNWMAYVQNYKNLDKIDFNKLLEDFKKFEEKKKMVVKYILNEDQDHRLNILDFKLIEDKMNV